MPAVLMALAAVAFLLVPPAHAASGGSLSGTLAVEWASGAADPGNAWTGAATLRMEPGAAATDRAIEAIRASGRVYREPRRAFVQASTLTALAMQQTTRTGGPDWCYDPETGERRAGEMTTSDTVTAITQPLVPMIVDVPSLNLLTGRGTVDVEFHTDNPGYHPSSSTYPFPAAGEYFMPVPGTAAVAWSRANCGEGEQGTREGSVFSTRGDALVPFALALWLNERDMRLRREGDAWRIAYEHAEEAVTEDADRMPLTMRYRLDLRMSGTPRSLGAQCKVPGDAKVRRLRSARAVRRLMARAGFPRTRLRTRRYVDIERPRFMRDSDFTSSGYRRCGDRGSVIRALPWDG